MTGIRLRHLIDVGPRPKRALDPNGEVCFAPMDALADGLGGLDVSLVKLAHEVSSGSYNYFEAGDILLAKVTPCFENGKKALVPSIPGGVGFATSEVHVVRPRPGKMDPRFLLYLFSSESFRAEGISSMTGAGGLKRVSEAAILNHRPRVTDIVAQQRIAAFLDAETARIDALIGSKQQMLVLFSERLQAIADLSTAPSRTDTTIPLRRALLKIEQGWSPECEARLVEGDEWGVLKVGCVNGWTFAPSEHKALPAALVPRPELEVRDGDVLMSRANTRELVGSVAIVEGAPRRLMLCDLLYRLTFDERKITKQFVVLALRSRRARQHYEVCSNGSSASMQKIRHETIRSLTISLPSIDRQRQLVATFEVASERLSTSSAKVRQSIDLLRDYRSALITEAVTGHLDIDAWRKRGRGEAQLDRIAAEAGE